MKQKFERMLMPNGTGVTVLAIIGVILLACAFLLKARAFVILAPVILGVAFVYWALWLIRIVFLDPEEDKYEEESHGPNSDRRRSANTADRGSNFVRDRDRSR